MSKRQIAFITGLFLLLLTSMHILWMLTFSWHPNPIQVEHGALDLSTSDFSENEFLSLDGQWAFYPNSHLMPDDLVNHDQSLFIPVPGDWNSYFEDNAKSTNKLGTYRLRISIAEDATEKIYKMQLPRKSMVAKIFVNNLLVLENDLEAVLSGKQNPGTLSRATSFSSNQSNEIDILIQVVDNTSSQAGGIVKSIKFGEETSINSYNYKSVGAKLLVITITLLFSSLSLLIFLLRVWNPQFLYYALANFFGAVGLSLDDDKLLLFWLPLNHIWSEKILLLSFIGVSAFVLLFFQSIFFKNKNIKMVWFLTVIHFFVGLLIIFTSFKYIPVITMLSYLVILCTFTIIAIHMGGFVKKGEKELLFLVLAAASGTSSFLWSFIESLSSDEIPTYPFDIIIASLLFAVYLFSRFLGVNDQNKELASKLQKEIQLKDDFLANTSHELRNPLHGIMNIAQSLLQNNTKNFDETSKRNMELLITISRHMSRTLNDLLDVTLLKENQILLDRSNVNLHSISAGIMDMLQFGIGNKDIQLELRIPKTFPEVEADKDRLIQILFNLLHNAIKFANKGTVSIDANVQDSMVKILIEDSGVGMDEETMNKIFEPYEQYDSGMTAIGSGLGLGLSICKQLVELHGGLLEVRSIKGQGSTFSFSLPLAKKAPEKSGINNSQATENLPFSLKTSSISASDLSLPLTYRPRILIVDDSPINLEVISDILPAERYEIVTLTNGKEALLHVKKQEWDLVVIDVMMPHMSGYELTREIRESFSISELPILMLTAKGQPEDVYTGFLAGANDYVTKPVDALELNVRVHALTNLKDSIGKRLRMEAAWLQAQIQPHFLFNTLNTIVSLNEIDTDRMTVLLKEFGLYLQKGFDIRNLDRVVPLEHELELIKSYLYIESARFGDRLTVHWDIHLTEKIQIPPLSIQTLVENAINHGILKKVSGGTITIQILDQTDYTNITIIDDGVGMDEQKMKQVLTTQPDWKRGIGLLNTDQRLKQMYGEGLILESKLGKGTRVTFRIPKE